MLAGFLLEDLAIPPGGMASDQKGRWPSPPRRPEQQWAVEQRAVEQRRAGQGF